MVDFAKMLNKIHRKKERYLRWYPCKNEVDFVTLHAAHRTKRHDRQFKEWLRKLQ